MQESFEEQKRLNKRFSNTWSKVWLYTIFKDKLTYFCDQTMQNLEINKRLCRLIEQRDQLVKKKQGELLAIRE